MFIAIEGADKTGKSTMSVNLATDGLDSYNVTKEMHEKLVKQYSDNSSKVIVYDRIDWFTHMVYRLALPEYEWNDARIRTVFTMPETHLLIKLHSKDSAGYIEDKLYKSGSIKLVNENYRRFADYLIDYNTHTDYSLFKSISLIEVNNSKEGFSQRLISTSSKRFFSWPGSENQISNEELFDLLRMLDGHQR